MTKKLEKNFNVKSLGSISLESDLSKFENNFTIETVTENLEIKKKIISSLNYKENIFSNTSSIKLSDIGQNINGFHFMNPVSIKLIEICKITNFSKVKLLNVLNKLKDFSYDIIDVHDSPGFLINKIIFKDISYFFYLIEKELFSVDNVLKLYQNDIKKINPIRLINIIGTDTCLHILTNLNKYDKKFYVPEKIKKAVKNNILGLKNKKLFKI